MLFIALNKQIHIYSLDTGCFYTSKEQILHDKMIHYSRAKRIIKKIDTTKCSDSYVERHKRIYKYINKKIKQYKNELLGQMKADPEIIRELHDDKLVSKRVISVFESTLTRISKMQIDELSKDIMVIQTFFYDIIEQLIKNGFRHNGDEYMYLTSSAGQIRTKKTVFIRKSLWKNIEKSLMCGLTVNKINAGGGINANKFLAYLALCNSATDHWVDFDIRRTIVVPDFETMVSGTVDYIDDESYEIERKNMTIPIPHMDGCGIILPKISCKNFMVRLPWVKGLLAPFDYYRFITENNCSSIIKDIYGKEWDVINDNIQIIFTESQFKMAKYYDSWEEFQNYFEKHKCQAGVCNVEEDYISNATINYQMLQTLTNVSKEELTALTAKSQLKLNKIATDRRTMLNVFGVTKSNGNKTHLQQALEIYPELLKDEYCKSTLRSLKKSLVKKYKSGKLEIDGKYTFLIPDLYAFCEWLFKGELAPSGLLSDQEVFCRLYHKSKKLDLLRSPHLYREHAVRNNIFSNDNKKWFITNGIYTSTHDIISKVLMFDNDGDKSLVVSDQLFVQIAERNMERDNIVPLYYDMKKANPTTLDNKALYDGLKAAYTGGNIGLYSNNISKIWNNDKFIYGSSIVQTEALYAIKCLCCQNNYVIDYAKTLYKPEFPVHVDAIVSKYIKGKLPHFFKYAKDKSNGQVESIHTGIVDQLDNMIKNSPLRFKLNFGLFKPSRLLHDSSTNIDMDIIQLFNSLNRKYHFQINSKNSENVQYVIKEARESLVNSSIYTEQELCDMITKHLYSKKTPHKELLWGCFGHILVENLKKNVSSTTFLCDNCGRRREREAVDQRFCEECLGLSPSQAKIITCIDCGEEFGVHIKDVETNRCKSCYSSYRRKYKAAKERERRRKLKNVDSR